MWNVANFMTEEVFKGMLLNGHPGGFVFFSGGLTEKGAQFFLGGCDLHRNCGMVVILLSFLPGKSFALVASKTVSNSIMSMM